MSRREVLVLPIGAGPAALDALPMLGQAMAGDGPALMPAPAGDGYEPARPAGRLSADEDDPDDPTALVVSTSGSTGDPKGALLSAGALRASAAATHDRLGGDGSWLLALPPHHIAGLQVLLRSVLAGTSPVAMDLRDGFSPNGFAAATRELSARTGVQRRYTSLVPTQLTRILDAGDEPLAALASYDGVLVGGAATAPAAIQRARGAGVAVVTTYGMSETCGGCVYDGRPLEGVWWRTEADGRVELGGDVVARGYRGAQGHPAFRIEPDGSRWFRTDDLGEVGVDGTLRIIGRIDDVILTGGLKVSPALVEAVLLDLPDVQEVVVVGVPDREWGERVVAVVVPSADRADGEPSRPLQLATLHRRVADHVASYAAPRQLVLVDQIPLIGPGKPDRVALRRLAASAPETS